MNNYFKYLLVKNRVEKLFYIDSIPNSMSEIDELLFITHSTGSFVVQAKLQTQGMGRNASVWDSPIGGLWFSFNLNNVIRTQLFPLFIGYCIHKVIADSFSMLSSQLHIKWPNDILYANKKIGGILCRYYAHQDRYLVGIGLNTNCILQGEYSHFQPESLQNILGFPVSNDYLLYSIMDLIYHASESNLKYHPENIVNYINNNLYAMNSIIEIYDDYRYFTGKCCGVEIDGSLQIQVAELKKIKLYSGSIIKVIDK